MAPNEKSHFDLSISFRLITHAKQLLEDNEETLCVRVLQTIKGMMARDIDFGDKVRNTKAVMFPRCFLWSMFTHTDLSVYRCPHKNNY